MMDRIKAVGLFSGGLDSALAIKLIQEQGIEVVALNYSSPFFSEKHGDNMKKLADKLGVKLKLVDKADEYIEIVKKPKHGHGKNINPCIDCKIFILSEAKKYAEEIGAAFIFTGEVVGQRPMSQHFKTLMMIEEEAGLAGKLVRPLSAGILPATEAEKNKWIDRAKLLKIRGRTRSQQLELSQKYGLDSFLSGTSGCRLTDPGYARRVRDLLEHNSNPSISDISLLSKGRHFRIGESKIIVGRNEEENKAIAELKNKSALLFEAKDAVGPTTLLRGEATDENIKTACGLTARYSDAKDDEVTILYGNPELDKEILIKKLSDDEIEKMRIG
jgi:tRNA-uridine 2-sulfurtransferase